MIRRPEDGVTSPQRTNEPWRRTLRGFVALTLVATIGCGAMPATSMGDAGGSDAGFIDAGAGEVGAGDVVGSDVGAVRPPASGQVVIDACLGQTGIAERCTLVTNASACTGARCSKPVVVFSGGEMGCVTGAGYHSVLAG